MHDYSDLIIGHWYKSQELEEIFEIVAIDAEYDCIEIQYFGGEISEFDLESWNLLNIEAIDAPEDWTGAYEINKEDLANYKEVIHPQDWNDPLTHLEQKNNQS